MVQELMGNRVGVPFRVASKLPPYENALRLVGLEPVCFTPETPARLEDLDGLLLAGGTDVDPELYGEDRDPVTDEPDKVRDRVELELLRDALNRDMPVLAICRGMQLFNVFHGGTLVQDLPRPHCHRQPGVLSAHTVSVCDESRLRRILGAGPFDVNSRHHQAVKRVAQGLIVAAVAEDGVVEAIERPGARFAIAVQWHPEDRVNQWPCDRKLFEAFAESCGPVRRQA
jgi:putative glutamine amidotransferase